jgi:protein O-GlcNAc transferase
MEEFKGFETIVPYLIHPLVLIGLVLLVFFGIHKALIARGVTPPVGPHTGGRLAQALLRQGAVIALLVILLGLVMAFYERLLETRIQENVDALLAPLQAKHRWEITEPGRGVEDWKVQIGKAVEALVELADTEDAPPGIDDALTLLAEGNTQAAEAVFQAITEQDRPNTHETAAAYRHLGALAFLHDPNKALDAYRRATELEPDNPAGWNELGHRLTRLGKLDEAEAAYRRVQALGEAENDKGAVAAAYGNLGILYWTRGNLDGAEAMFRQSLEIEEAVGHNQGMADQYGQLGLLYQTRGDLGQAEAMYHKALDIDETLGRMEHMSTEYGNLGVIFQIQGDLDQAEAMHLKALKIDATLGRKRGMATQYSNLGILYKNRGDLVRAETMSRNALGLNAALNLKQGMAANYGNLGNVYLVAGDVDQAEEMFRKALAIYETLGSSEGMAGVYRNLGVLYENRGHLDQAEAMYLQALPLFLEIGAKDRAQRVEELLQALK